MPVFRARVAAFSSRVHRPSDLGWSCFRVAQTASVSSSGGWHVGVGLMSTTRQPEPWSQPGRRRPPIIREAAAS